MAWLAQSFDLYNLESVGDYMKRHKTLRQSKPTAPQGASNNLPAKYLEKLLSVPKGGAGAVLKAYQFDFFCLLYLIFMAFLVSILTLFAVGFALFSKCPELYANKVWPWPQREVVTSDCQVPRKIKCALQWFNHAITMAIRLIHQSILSTLWLKRFGELLYFDDFHAS